MVVRKVMRWSPWAPTAVESKRKFRVRVKVERVDGLFPGSSEANVDGGNGEAPPAVSVEIRWKGPPRSRGLSYLRGRKKPERCVLVERALRDGAAEWEDGDNAAFDNVCGFSVVDRDGSFSAWDVSFHLLYVSGDGGERKLEEIGTTMLNLGDLASQLHREEERESSEQFQFSRKLSITLRAGCADIKLSVAVSFAEIKSTPELSEPTSQAASANERNQKGEANAEKTTEDPCAPDSDASDGAQQQLQPFEVTTTSGEDSGDCSCSRSSSDAEGGSSAAQSRSPPRRGFLSWRKRRKTHDVDGGEQRERIGVSPSSNSSTSLDEKDVPGDLSAGSWEERELISRDGQTKLNVSTFFASIDQRDESAGGESACTALVVVIADALQSNQMNTPTRSQFDALVREGSSEWQKLCNVESYSNRFPDKHFDLDTILEAHLRPISVSPEKSYVGFFQPQNFESLRGAMSFDDIWNEITRSSEEGGEDVYIVSWNDHFFLLKVEANAFYVIDTLGERLFEGCNKAYILRFDTSAFMYRVPEQERDEQELICSGKGCCREFINRFLAAIPLREELEAEEKRGEGPSINPRHQRLQIEFHLVRSSDERKPITAVDGTNSGDCG